MEILFSISYPSASNGFLFFIFLIGMILDYVIVSNGVVAKKVSERGGDERTSGRHWIGKKVSRRTAGFIRYRGGRKMKSKRLVIGIVCFAVSISTAAALKAQPWGGFEFNRQDSPVILNEIMANPGSGSDNELEFVELWNTGSTWIDIGGWEISDEGETDVIVDFTSYSYDIGLTGTAIPPGGYALIVESDYRGAYNEYLELYAGVNNFILVCVDDGEIGYGLNDDGDTVTVTPALALVNSFSKSYSSNAQLHQGESLEQDRYKPNTWHWSPDPQYGCTPGGINSY